MVFVSDVVNGGCKVRGIMQIISDISKHYGLLGHADYGVTELRTIKPVALVAYADNECDFIRLCKEMDGAAAGIYVGVQPRPTDFFEMAKNCWRPAIGGALCNCAKDQDIEYITTLFFDIDVDTPQKNAGHPASDQELQNAIQTARLIADQPQFKGCASICLSGNGCYVAAPIVPIAVYDDLAAQQFKLFCESVIGQIAPNIPAGVRIDPVYNLSRIMRVIGTINKKGNPIPGRPHRRSSVLELPDMKRSYELHQWICHMETSPLQPVKADGDKCLRCNLNKLEDCQFIQWCRACPDQVSEPQWFGLISNLTHLEGGVALIHEISSLDKRRYDYKQTERVITRMLDRSYKPTSCQSLVKLQICGRSKFICSRIMQCAARAPMYMAVNRIVF